MLPNVSLMSSTLREASAPVLASEPGAGDSLESRFLSAVADMSADFEGDRARIADAVSNADASDPQSMIELQTQLADYGLQVAMVSTLARKAVGAVEALLR